MVLDCCWFSTGSDVWFWFNVNVGIVVDSVLHHADGIVVDSMLHHAGGNGSGCNMCMVLI